MYKAEEKSYVHVGQRTGLHYGRGRVNGGIPPIGVDGVKYMYKPAIHSVHVHVFVDGLGVFTSACEILSVIHLLLTTQVLSSPPAVLWYH